MQTRMLIFIVEAKDEDCLTTALSLPTKALEDNGIHIVKGCNAPANVYRSVNTIDVTARFPHWLHKETSLPRESNGT